MVGSLPLSLLCLCLSLSLRTRLLPSNGEERQGKWFPRQAFNLALISNLPSAHVSTFHLVALCFPQLSLSLSLSPHPLTVFTDKEEHTVPRSIARQVIIERNEKPSFQRDKYNCLRNI